VPIADWIAGPHAGVFRDEVLTATSPLAAYVDARELRARFDAHVAGRADNGYLLWAAWCLRRWLGQAVNDSLQAPRLS
jgi:hypothetical protein